MSEASLQNAVIQAAALFGWRSYHTRFSIGSSAGFPDLVLVSPGRVAFVELKSATGGLTPAQREWQEALFLVPQVERYVWYPAQWLDGTIEAILRGEGRE